VITPNAPVTRESVAAHYDDLDLFYRGIWGEHVHHGFWETEHESVPEAVERLVDRVADALKLAAGERVVDIGCGYGGTARRLVESRGVQVTALTLSPQQHRYAAQLEPASANPDYHLGDWLENDFFDDSFDAALAIESTEHMADKAGVFREIARVLKPGGRMAVCAWIAADAPGRFRIRHLLEPICREGRLPGLGTESDYRGWIEAAGLTLEPGADWTAAVRSTWSRCLKATAARLVADPATRTALRRLPGRDRVFLLTTVRIWAAYRWGAMRYLLFVARKPGKR
jgi:tocopherol O-methyltransferase